MLAEGTPRIHPEMSVLSECLDHYSSTDGWDGMSAAPIPTAVIDTARFLAARYGAVSVMASELPSIAVWFRLPDNHSLVVCVGARLDVVRVLHESGGNYDWHNVESVEQLIDELDEVLKR